MGIRHYKPTTPGRRQGSVSDFAETHRPQEEAGEVAAAPQAEEGRPQQPGHRLHALPRRRPQADVPHHRLQAPQGRRLGDGRRHRIRPEPLGPDRPAPVRGRREGVHPGAGRAEGRRQGHQRRGGRAARRQLPAAAAHSAGHDRSTTWRCSRAAAGSSAAAPAPAPR